MFGLDYIADFKNKDVLGNSSNFPILFLLSISSKPFELSLNNSIIALIQKCMPNYNQWFSFSGKTKPFHKFKIFNSRTKFSTE